MTIYLYKNQQTAKDPEINIAINLYVRQLNLKVDKTIVDTQQLKTSWRKRALFSLLDQAQEGDEIIVHSPSHLACSIAQILSILQKAHNQKVSIRFAHSFDMFQGDEQSLLSIIMLADHELVSNRTKAAVLRRRKDGLPLGRPPGSLNKTLILDKHEKEIDSYLKKGISKASISKLVDCNPQTLYDWMKRRKIRSRK